VTAYVYHIRLHGLNLQCVWSASALVVGHLLVLVLPVPATCCMWLDWEKYIYEEFKKITLYRCCSYFQIEWANCLSSSYELHLRFISVICAPRAHDKSKVGWHVPHGVGAYGGVIISLSRPWARRLINHWSLWRMASATPDLYGCLPSRRASPPLDRYHIILLGDSSTCVNNLPKVVTWKQNGRDSNRRLFWVASPMSTFV